MNRSDLITLEKLRNIGSYIESSEENKKPFIIIGENRYARALFYIVSVESEIKKLKCYTKKSGFEKDSRADEKETTGKEE